MFQKKKPAKKTKGILIALKVNKDAVEKKEQRRQALQETMLVGGEAGRDARKTLVSFSNIHLGNKLNKPDYLWNPECKKQAMTKIK